MTVWTPPKTNWSADDGAAYTDFNRIEGNTDHLKAIHDVLEGEYDTHAADTSKHKTSEQVRTETGTPFCFECRTSDPTAPITVGRAWLRTDL